MKDEEDIRNIIPIAGEFLNDLNFASPGLNQMMDQVDFPNDQSMTFEMRNNPISH